jgi:hypothetical protein
MNKKSKIVLGLFSALIIAGVALFSFLLSFKTLTEDSMIQKALFVSVITLPDLAMGSSIASVRHRTLYSFTSLEPTLKSSSYEAYVINTNKGMNP